MLTTALFLAATLDSAPTLQTRWAAKVNPSAVLREYPRPQLVRDGWLNLNGRWTLQVIPVQRRPGMPMLAPPKIARTVLVPFPLESQLSGVRDLFDHGFDQDRNVYVYSRTFDRPRGDRLLLHFGAVNWDCRVAINGVVAGRHQGGYDPFTLDITKFVTSSGPQTVSLEVSNPVDAGSQPRGKQVRKPGGIFYTASTGIWQTVWAEGVPETFIDGVHTNASAATGSVKCKVDLVGLKPVSAIVEVLDGARLVGTARIDRRLDGRPSPAPMALQTNSEPVEMVVNLSMPNHINWSPENPHLYNVKVSLVGESGQVVDRVTSYFAFRDMSLVSDSSGQPHVALNGKPYFLFGTLDQGFWPDGIYTAPTDDALKSDIEVTKRLGFNMIRKHVKVEPERWYYWCDRLGVIVLQDMPSGDKYIGGNDPDISRSPLSAADFEREIKAMVDTHSDHPCIGAWVLYNEGWGQWDTARMTRWLKEYDPSRLVDSTTGWADRGVGDFSDIHSYPGPAAPSRDPKRAIFLGEFGGLGLPEPGHMWLEKGWGYQSFKTSDELTTRFEGLMAALRKLREAGLSGAVYTQTTDCETELNGLMPYDRAFVKMDEARTRRAIANLMKPL